VNAIGRRAVVDIPGSCLVATGGGYVQSRAAPSEVA
jgi:hypothetical protein